ncbi:MAG: AgmX/PglI C-terminal domain-containing protein [Myxococcales bacterium]
MAHVQPEHHAFRSRPVSAAGFGFASAQENTYLTEPDAPTHVLLKQRSLEPGEFERVGVEAIEIMGFWGSTILFAKHQAATQSFTVGEGNAAMPVDFEIAAQQLGMASAQIVQVTNGTAHVVVPPAARVRVKQAHEPYAQESNATSIALLAGTVVELELGKLTFRVANVAAAQSTPREALAGDRSALSAFGVSFAIVGALVASFAFWMPAMGLTDGEDLDSDRLETMKQYLSAQAERNREEEAEKDQSGNKDNQPGAPAEAAQGREGAMGKLNAPVTNHRAAVRGDAPQISLSRAQQLESARNFGMIELLGTLSTSAGGGSPFVRDPALGSDGFDAEGGMFGDPGESGGFGGLRLSGLDQGGGGHGFGVALGGIGTCGTGNCGPAGFGHSVGNATGEHKTRPPGIRMASNSTVSGHLPPEVVQRIVRQNYGRFRMCYENGLHLNPNLTGRVTARFVIGREGAVTNAANGGSDMPDSGVTSCVVQAFYGLSFPKPENGIVTVSYPIMFSPG